MVSLSSKSVSFEERKEFKTSKTQVTTRKGFPKKVEENKPKNVVIQIEDDPEIPVQTVDVEKIRN